MVRTRSPSMTTAQPTTHQPEASARDQVRPGIPGRSDEGPLSGHLVVLVCTLTVIGLLIRIPTFRNSLFGDEISTYYIVAGHSLSRVLRLVESNQETSPPLYFIVAWATRGLLSNTGESIRLVSLVAGTAAIPLTFLLGVWTVGRRAALVGATLMVLSPAMIVYSGQARPFMMTLFLALLSTIALLRGLDTGRLGWWIAYAAFTCGTAYTHYTAVFVLAIQLVWALWTQPQARRAIVAANVAAALGYIPWINGVREDLHAPNYISFVAPLNLHSVLGQFESAWMAEGKLAVTMLAVGLAIGVLSLALKARGTRLHVEWSSRTVLVVLIAFGPTVLNLLYSVVRADIFGEPMLIYSWPALAVLIGLIVASPPRPLWLAAVALTVGAYAIGGYQMLGSVAQNPDVNAVAGYIDRVGSSGDPIVCYCFTAGALTELDVALADAGQSQKHPIIRLGTPTQAEVQRTLSGPNPQPGLLFPPPAPPKAIANQSVALSHNGTIFFVTDVLHGSVGVLRSSQLLKKEFFDALPARFRVVGHMTYPGLSGAVVESVYTIRDAG